MSDSLIPSFLMNDVSESLRLLTKTEQMSESLIFWANRSFAHFFAKNERFAQKTDERIPNPANTASNWYDLDIFYYSVGA